MIARILAERATVVDPSLGYANYVKGFVHYFQKQELLAFRQLDLALEKGPDEFSISPNKIRVVRFAILKSIHGNRESKFRLATALRDSPKDMTLLQILAMSQVLDGAVDDAGETLKRMVATDPDHPATTRTAVAVHSATGNVEGILYYTKVWTKQSPDSVTAWTKLAIAFTLKRQFDRALAAIDTAIRLRPTELEPICAKVLILCTRNADQDVKNALDIVATLPTEGPNVAAYFCGESSLSRS